MIVAIVTHKLKLQTRTDMFEYWWKHPSKSNRNMAIASSSSGKTPTNNEIINKSKCSLHCSLLYPTSVIMVEVGAVRNNYTVQIIWSKFQAANKDIYGNEKKNQSWFWCSWYSNRIPFGNGCCMCMALCMREWPLSLWPCIGKSQNSTYERRNTMHYSKVPYNYIAARTTITIVWNVLAFEIFLDAQNGL